LKNKTTLISIIFLLIIAIYFAFFKDRNSVFNKYDFALKDTSQINLIIFENSLSKVILKKDNNEWKVNRNYYANHTAIKNFLRVFSNLDFVSKVDNKLKDSISTELSKLGTKITIKSNESIISELIIGDINDYKTGTYVKKNKMEAVIVNATGITNNISKVISTNSLFWRNKTIFNFNVDEIKKIEFYNKTNEEKSFIIEKKDDIYVLSNFKNKEIKNNINKIKRYLSYYRKINFETVENKFNQIKKNIIIKNNLAYKIIVIDNKNIKYKLELYFKPNLKKTEYKYDLNNIYGTFNKDTNLLIIPYYTIDPIHYLNLDFCKKLSTFVVFKKIKTFIVFLENIEYKAITNHKKLSK